MKFSRSFRLAMVAALGLGSCAAGSLSASTNLLVNARTTSPATAPSVPGAPKVEGLVVTPPFIAPEAPESEFIVPKDKSVGRDPFFPKSTRPFGEVASTKIVVAVKPVADLALKGISGSKEQPLAIVNTTTFTAGEENDVMTKAGRMRIRCLEINMDAGTVLIQVGGERRELRLNAK